MPSTRFIFHQLGDFLDRTMMVLYARFRVSFNFRAGECITSSLPRPVRCRLLRDTTMTVDDRGGREVRHIP